MRTRAGAPYLFFLSAGHRGHVVTLRPLARSTTPCVYGVVDFGVSTDRGTELPSGLYVFE